MWLQLSSVSTSFANVWNIVYSLILAAKSGFSVLVQKVLLGNFRFSICYVI